MKAKNKILIYFFVLMIGVVIIFFFNKLIFFKNQIEKNDISKNITTISLDKVSEIPQSEKYFVAKPAKMLGYKNKIYIIDRKFYRILVFTKNGFSHVIGRPGQGPGEITQVTSFDISKDRLYILNGPNRIEIFDISGQYKKTIRLKKPEKYFATDLKIFGQYMYIGYDLGETRVRRYSLEGNFIDNFIKGGAKISSYKYILSNPIAIYIIPVIKELLLFNCFSGDIDTFDIESGETKNKIKNYDSQITQRISSIKKKLKKRNLKGSSKEIKSILMLKPTLDEKNSKLYIIPSQISVNTKDRRKVFYVFDLNSNLINKSFLKINQFYKIIRDCSFIQNKLVLMDYELNLFIGEKK